MKGAVHLAVHAAQGVSVAVGRHDEFGRQISQLGLESGPRGDGMELGLRAGIFGGLLGRDAVASETGEPLAEVKAVERAAARAVAVA